MEYLTTYGWAILIIVIVIGVIVGSGILDQTPPQICALNNQFACSAMSMASNGVLQVNITQLTGSVINITALGCDSNLNLVHVTHFSPAITVASGSSIIKNVSCYVNNTVYTAKLGSSYAGYIILNYTVPQSGFSHSLAGKLIQTVTH